MNIDQVKKIAVIGAGNMGHQIAMLCALHGFDTACTDNAPEQLAKAENFVETYLPGRVAKERITQAEADRAAALIRFTPDFEAAVREADVVIEAVFENETLKREIFTRLEAVCRPEAVFFTNASYTSSSVFADCFRDPGRICNMHFFNPALVMKCVEIMCGPHTADATFALAAALVQKLGKTPTRINREIDGMVVNRILLNAIRDEAYYLLEGGYASAEDIDNAVCGGLGHPMGPFRLNDLTGIDLTYLLGMQRFHRSGNKADLPWPTVTEKYFKGEWGRKTGKGFYEYPDGKPEEKDGKQAK